MSRHILRNSTLALLLALLGATAGQTFTHHTSLVAGVHAAATSNGPGGGDPDPTDPPPHLA